MKATLGLDTSGGYLAAIDGEFDPSAQHLIVAADMNLVFWEDLNNVLWVSALFALGLVGIVT